DGRDAPPAEETEEERATRLFLPGPDAEPAEEEQPEDGGEAATERARPVRVAGPATLPRRRELARALRPLKRRVPSAVRTVLDEDATAGRIAEHRHWLPVLVPAADRWLDVSLVLDAYDGGAAFWEPLGHELRLLLERLGAFRDVRLHHLLARPDGSAGLRATSATPGHQLRAPASAVDPTGRTLTLVLTDGVSPAWRTETLLGPLRTWATSGPTAILQTLPERVWDGTPLSPEPARFRSTEAGGPNTRLLYEGYRLDAAPPAAGAVAVPVLGLTPDWLAPWARAVAGPGAYDSAAVVVPEAGALSGAAAPAGIPEPRAGFEEFRARAHPEVFRLAAYLAAAPLNLAVMRTIQSAMLPDSPPSDLAEIVYSGLLHRVGASARTDGPLDRAYDFAPGVRERLLTTLRRDEADEVITAVSAYYERHSPGFAARFTAAITDPEGPLTLPVGARHWAEVHNLVRRRQGRVAARRAERREEPRAREEREGRRFLVTIGVSNWLAEKLMPRLPEDLHRIQEAFAPLGYERAWAVLNPSAADLRNLTAWVESFDPRSDDVIVVYFAGYFAVEDGRVVLGTADYVPGAMQVAFDGLLRSGAGHVMFLFDADRPQQPSLGLEYLFEAAPAPTNVWALTMPVSHASTDGSYFSKAVSEVLRTLKAHPTSPFVPVQDFFHRLRQLLRSQRPALEIELTASTPHDEPAPFFPNPAHAPVLPPERLGFIPNVAALTALSSWVRTGASSTCLVVGSHGSGKTMLLTSLMALGDPSSPLRRRGLPPEARPPTDVRYVSVDDAHDVVHDTERRIVVVADEVATPALERALNDLAALPHVLVVASALPEEVPALDGEPVVVDLDSPEYRIPTEPFVRFLLAGSQAGPDEVEVLTEQITLLSGDSRTLAGLLARQVRERTGTQRGFGGIRLPEVRRALDAYIKDFGADALMARRMLHALAYAAGGGVPLAEWRTMTTALFGGRCDAQDVERLASQPQGLTVMSAGPDGVWFRLPHPALADALRSDDDQVANQAAITRALIRLVPTRPGDSGPDWPRAGRYARR
ncbi:SAV_2336 N-terminal domain-related protein, partial [Streptomyces sp.]|uniref:SAV_2336 N-terminal domain-related protein n=1 Tax=Streptomyces sp. TaxID=1931 RepID=UPI002F948C48